MGYSPGGNKESDTTEQPNNNKFILLCRDYVFFFLVPHTYYNKFVNAR